MTRRKCTGSAFWGKKKTEEHSMCVGDRLDSDWDRERRTLVCVPIRPVTVPIRPVTIPIRPVTIPIRPVMVPIRPVTIPIRPVTVPIRPVTIPIRPVTIPMRSVTIDLARRGFQDYEVYCLLPPTLAYFAVLQPGLSSLYCLIHCTTTRTTFSELPQGLC